MAKVKAPVEEFIANKAESSPPFNDQVTVSSVVYVWTVVVFSAIDVELVDESVGAVSSAVVKL